MAKFFVLNLVRFGTAVLKPGTEVDSNAVDTSALAANGAILVESSSPTLRALVASIAKMGLDPQAATDLLTSVGLVITASDSYSSGSGAVLIAQIGGRLSIFSGTASAPVLPLAANNLNATVIVKCKNLAAGVVVGVSGADTIDGQSSYTVAGSWQIASFIADAAGSWLAAPGNG
jgi:hypothetical protein